MTDRTLRFAARMISVGLLGVAWTIATLTMVVVHQSAAGASWQLKTMGYLGMLPVAGLLIYVILTDFADWHLTRRFADEQGESDEQE